MYTIIVFSDKLSSWTYENLPLKKKKHYHPDLPSTPRDHVHFHCSALNVVVTLHLYVFGLIYTSLAQGGKVTDGVTFALIVTLQAKALPSIPVKYQENTYQRTTLTNLCQP